MRTTVFELCSGGVVTDVREEPGWRPFEEYDGKPLERVRVQDLLEPTGALVQLVEIAKGGSFAMHSSPDVAFCRPSHSHDGGGAGPPDYCHRRDTRGRRNTARHLDVSSPPGHAAARDDNLKHGPTQLGTSWQPAAFFRTRIERRSSTPSPITSRKDPGCSTRNTVMPSAARSVQTAPCSTCQSGV